MKDTINIHETEIRSEAREVKEPGPASRASAAVLTRLPVVMPPFAQRAMFSDSLLEFGFQRKRKFLATTTSFVLNCIALTVLVALPLVFTEQLPKAQLLTFLVAPPPPPPPPPPAAAEQMRRVVRQIQTDMLSSGQLRTPTKIPQTVQMIKEEEAPPPMPATGGVVGGVPGGVPGGQLGGVIGGIVSSTASLLAVPKLAPPQRIRISQGVTKGLLIHRIEPTYPPLARAARIQGEVVLTAIISTNGDIENLQLVSGHPMLVPAAIAAVRQWHYKPYLLNGQPVEVETTITVIFSLTS
jgi:periplasmic protein TonB